MAAETTTPNIGLQVPAFNQANWQVPNNFNWNLLDLYLSGQLAIPALHVVSLTADNAGNFRLPPSICEQPVGAIPGTVYTLSRVPTPATMLQFTYNNSVLRQGIDYTVLSNIVTLNFSTTPGDTVYASYFYSV